MNNNKPQLKRIFSTAVLAVVLLVLLWLVTALALFSAPLFRPVSFSVLEFWLVLIVAPISFWFDVPFGNVGYSLVFHRYDSWLTALTILFSLSYFGVFAGVIHATITKRIVIKSNNPAKTAEQEFWLRYRWLFVAIVAVLAYYVVLTNCI